MDVLPAWAAAVVREKLGLDQVTAVQVLKDTPFHKIVVVNTPRGAVLAEKGLLGANAYLLPAAVANPRPAPLEGPRSKARRAQRPAPRRKPPAEAKPPPRAKAPTGTRGKVAPRRKPSPRLPPAEEPATASEPAPEPAREAPRASAEPRPRGRPVELLEGIGPAYGATLREHGVATIEDLLAAEPARLAERAGLSPELVGKWQSMAALQQVDVIGPQSSELLVRAGIRDLAALATETPESLAKRLGDYEGAVGLRVQNLSITPELCAGWIQGARETLDRKGP